MPEYQSPNGFGDSAANSQPENDFEPSASDIDKWQGESQTEPSAPEEADVESSEAGPAPEEKQEHTAKPEKKQTPLQKHRQEKSAKQSHETNELYKQIRILSKENRDLKQKQYQREQGLDQKPEDWEKLAQQFEQYGDFAKAESAKQEANRLRQEQANYQQSQVFIERWHSNEAEILEQDPDLFNPDTETGKRMGAIFNNSENKELADRYRAHPDGIWAAYHRVKAEYAGELIPKLVQVIETQQSELAKFKKSNSPMRSTPGKGSHTGPKSLKDMSMDELEKLAYAEAADIDRG